MLIMINRRSTHMLNFNSVYLECELQKYYWSFTMRVETVFFVLLWRSVSGGRNNVKPPYCDIPRSPSVQPCVRTKNQSTELKRGSKKQPKTKTSIRVTVRIFVFFRSTVLVNKRPTN